MDKKIPIATDNIFKFSATFGLVLIISSFALIILLFENTNLVIFKNAAAIYDLDISDRSQEDKERRAKLLEKEVAIAIENRRIGMLLITVLFLFGAAMSWTGFSKWRKEIQPLHDSLLLLERDKSKIELELLKNKIKP